MFPPNSVYRNTCDDPCTVLLQYSRRERKLKICSWRMVARALMLEVPTHGWHFSVDKTERVSCVRAEPSSTILIPRLNSLKASCIVITSCVHSKPLPWPGKEVSILRFSISVACKFTYNRIMQFTMQRNRVRTRLEASRFPSLLPPQSLSSTVSIRKVLSLVHEELSFRWYRCSEVTQYPERARIGVETRAVKNVSILRLSWRSSIQTEPSLGLSPTE